MIGQRIESIRKMLGFSQAQLASSLGISQQAYGNYERNESEPKIAMLIKIAELGSCTLEWLMTGVNSTFIPPRANANNLVPTVSPSKGNWYPIIGKVRAGTEIIYTDEDVIGEIFIDYYKTALCFCVTVEGDSMLPRLSAGDVVLVDPSDTPVSGDIVVVVLSGRQMIKKYVVTREGIEFHSYNENYPVIYPSGDEDVQGIFRVVMIQPKPIHL